MYLTIRKSLSKSADQNQSSFSTNHHSDMVSDIESLSEKSKLSQSANVSLQNKYEDALNECKIHAKQVDSLEKKTKEYELKVK